MPVRNVLVGDSGGDVEHDDAALAVDVVSVSETTKLLLPRRVPYVELNWTVVLLLLLECSLLMKDEPKTHRREGERMDLYT